MNEHDVGYQQRREPMWRTLMRWRRTQRRVMRRTLRAAYRENEARR